MSFHNETIQMKLKTINVLLLSLASSVVYAGTMGPMDNFNPSLYFKVGSGGSYSMSAGINNPNPAYWDASPQGYNGDVGQSALYSAAIGYNYSQLISTDFEYIYRPSFNYTKYQTSTATNTIFFNGDKTRYFNLESNSLMWNIYLHGKGYSDTLTYHLYDNFFVEPFIGGGIGAAFNTVSNFHSILSTGSVKAIEANNLMTSLAWQFTAGVNFFNHDHLSLGTGYRYYNGQQFSSNSYIINTQDTAPNWTGTIQANEFFIQLNYKL